MQQDILVDRNTPTGVGKTVFLRQVLETPEKHPHGCGEDGVLTAVTAMAGETPPRVWGRHPQDLAALAIVGNTPTGVGKTPSSLWRASIHEKHPHGCGEDRSLLSFMACMRETPPRVWGRLCTFQIYPTAYRNTPTGVGKTSSSLARTSACQKHPHGCGEDNNRQQLDVSVKETPPRVWGRHLKATNQKRPLRNTPTGVGKT